MDREVDAKQLAFFPTPYPDELWYSVLCRFYVRSGVCGFGGYGQVVHSLFGEQKLRLCPYSADIDFGGLFERLPKGFLDKKEMLKKHTLAPYLLRFSSVELKKSAWRYLLDGERTEDDTRKLVVWNDTFLRDLRYCPLCIQEDAARYGEAYWHNAHQIHLMPLCPKHRCRLEDTDITWAAKGTCSLFAPASKENCTCTRPVYEKKKYEESLTDVLFAFLYDREGAYGSAAWGSCLCNKLLKGGYITKTVTRADTEKLYSKLQAYYGETLRRVLRSEKGLRDVLQYLPLPVNARSLTEKYALLATYLCMDPHALTGDAFCEDEPYDA